MNEIIENKLKERVEESGYNVTYIDEIIDDDEFQELIYMFQEKYELHGPIDKLYCVYTEEETSFIFPVIYGELEEELFIKRDEGYYSEEDDYDDEDLSDPDNPFSDDF